MARNGTATPAPSTPAVMREIGRLANGDKLMAGRSEYKGKMYVSIRAYYESPAGSGEFAPGRNGLNVPESELPLLREAFKSL